MYDPRPLVLVHGLWNSPQLFDRLIKELNQPDFPLSRPCLPHGYGSVALWTLAEQLEHAILKKWGSDVPSDLLGFSMGGIVARVWLQKFNGARRTHRFISIGSPHFGTFTANLAPHCLLAGIADMGRNSLLLRELNRDMSSLKSIYCFSYF